MERKGEERELKGKGTYRKICFVPSRGGRRVAIVLVAMMTAGFGRLQMLQLMLEVRKYRGGPCAEVLPRRGLTTVF
jgi:hypothetical protein